MFQDYEDTKENKEIHEYFRKNFAAIHGQEFFPLLFKYLLHSDPSFTISYDAEELYKCIEYFDCTTEEFSKLMRIQEPELLELLSHKNELPHEINVRLSRVTMLLILGEDKFGSKNAFLDRFERLDKKKFNMLQDEDDYLALVKSMIE